MANLSSGVTRDETRPPLCDATRLFTRFFFISIMKVYDNFPKAKHQALKNTIEMIAEEEIITLIGFQDQVQVQVAVHIVSNQGSVD